MRSMRFWLNTVCEPLGDLVFNGIPLISQLKFCPTSITSVNAASVGVNVIVPVALTALDGRLLLPATTSTVSPSKCKRPDNVVLCGDAYLTLLSIL